MSRRQGAAGLLVAVLACASCSLLPSTVRVALPPGDPAAAAAWHRFEAALPRGAGVPTVEVVAPGSVPPPDLVWFDGNFDDPAYRDKALGANGQVEALGRQAGVLAAWFDPGADRIFPLAWAPWAWWTEPGTRVAGGPVLVPYADAANLGALARVQGASEGPTLGGDAGQAVWDRWGPAARDEGKLLTVTAALDQWKTGTYRRIWANAADLAAPGVPRLEALPAETVAARVRGFWWNADGWNRDRVPGLLAALWSPAVQDAAVSPGWVGAGARGPFSSAKRILLLP